MFCGRGSKDPATKRTKSTHESEATARAVAAPAAVVRLHFAPPALSAAAAPLVAAGGFGLEDAATAAHLENVPAVALCHWTADSAAACSDLLSDIARNSPQAFTVAVGPLLGDDPAARLSAFDAGAKMVAPDLTSLPILLNRIRSQYDDIHSGSDAAAAAAAAVEEPRYQCQRCGLALTEAGLHTHDPLYHGAAPNEAGRCQICATGCPAQGHRNLACHLHNCHGPVAMREPPAPAWAAFAWVVCQRESDGKFLLVNEPAGICGSARPAYWLPAGRVDAGETVVEAAVREAEEEAGVDVEVTGLLRCMLSRGTPRIVLLAKPRDPANDAPKCVPDWESAGALWVDAAEMVAKLREENGDYRARDPVDFFPALASGELVPCSLETPAWARFEALVKQLTAADRGGGNGPGLEEAWAELQAAYPPALFRR